MANTPTRPLRVIFMGTPDFAVPSLRKLIDRGDEIVAVVTQPDRPKGRGKRLAPPPIKTLALEHDLRVLQPERVRRAPFPDELAALAPDVVVVVAFGQILPKSILDIPARGCINVHASLLPRWRGAAPINWCIAAGDEVTGVTTMHMDEGMDTGDMLLKAECPVTDATRAEELTPELARLGADLLGGTLDALVAGRLTPTPQDDALATKAPMMTKSDGFVDFARPAREVVRLIHAMTPWPGAVVRLGDAPLKLFAARVVPSDRQSPPGRIVEVSPQSFTVAAADDYVELLEIQAPGKRRMATRDFLAGHDLQPGGRLERVE